ncbi:MAG: clan AA aspartic protease [Armatimonadetes bacterium]|nr:clan AA aspartic protease [Armatimonadota bacterium]
MIVGQVDARRHSVVSLVVIGPTGQQETILFQVDTCFNGSLMLPAAQIAALGLPQVEELSIRLADGSRIGAWQYLAHVEWDGQVRQTRVVASGSQPLLGMSLALGYNISINMVDGGRVALTRLPSSAP